MALTANDKREHLLGISIVLAFLLPHSSTMFLLVNPMLCVILWFVFRSPKISSSQYLVLFSITITVLISITTDIETKAIMRVASMMTYFIFFPMVSGEKVRNEYLFFCLVVIIASQFAFLFNIPFVSSAFSAIYPPDMEAKSILEYQRSIITTSSINSFRFDGLYYNGNQLAKFLSFLLVYYLYCNKDKPFRNLIVFVLLIFVSVLITGSRTGFIVVSLIIFFTIQKREDVSKAIKTSVILVGVVAAIYIFVNGSDTYRSLNIQSGMSDSLGSKVKAMIYYLSSEQSGLRLLFGHCDSTLFHATGNVMNSFDNEFGNLLYTYGFVGTLMMFVFVGELFKQTSKENRIVFIPLLWAFTSTIIDSYRCSFVFFLLFSSLMSMERDAREGYLEKYYSINKES